VVPHPHGAEDLGAGSAVVGYGRAWLDELQWLLLWGMGSASISLAPVAVPALVLMIEGHWRTAGGTILVHIPRMNILAWPYISLVGPCLETQSCIM